MWGFMIGLVVGYMLAHLDYRYPQRPPVLRGDYEGCESKEEQDKEYPDNWS